MKRGVLFALAASRFTEHNAPLKSKHQEKMMENVFDFLLRASDSGNRAALRPGLRELF